MPTFVLIPLIAAGRTGHTLSRESRIREFACFMQEALKGCKTSQRSVPDTGRAGDEDGGMNCTGEWISRSCEMDFRNPSPCSNSYESNSRTGARIEPNRRARDYAGG